MKNDPNKVSTAPFDLGKALAGHPLVTVGTKLEPEGKQIGRRRVRKFQRTGDLRTGLPYTVEILMDTTWHACAISEDGKLSPGVDTIGDLLLDTTTPWRGKFDRQKALDGHPLVTRNGEKVHSLEPYDDPNFPLLANCGSRDMEIGGKKYYGLVVKRCYTRKGRASMDTKGPMDLFLDLRAKFEQAHADQKAEPPGRKMINCRCVAVPELHPFPTKLAISHAYRLHPQEVEIDAIEPEEHYRIASVVVRREDDNEDDPNLLRFAEALVARFNAHALAGIAKVFNPETQEADER